MSTKLVEIRNLINALIVATLPGYVKLADGIDLDDNPNLYMQKGFKTSYRPGSYNGREYCITSIQRLRYFDFALTALWPGGNLKDGDTNEGFENALMIDWDLVIKKIHSDPNLLGENILTTYVSDGGLEYVIDTQEVKKYIMIVTTIAVDYYEGV